MDSFIQVLGRDLNFKNASLYQYIAANTVVRVFPYWGIPDKGNPQIFRNCKQGQEGGQIFSYGVVTADGKEYSCGSKEELTKLGITLNESLRTPICFKSETEGRSENMLDPIEP